MADARGNDLVVILLIDALGWEIARHFEFARDVLPHAGPLETVLGYSSAAIPSLLSGQPPSRHGAWAMYRYAPETSPFKWLRFLPPLPHALEWRVRVLARRVIERKKSIRGYYDLYEIPLDVLGRVDVSLRGDPYAPGGMKEETFFDCLGTAGIDYRLWTYRTAEAKNFELLRAALSSGPRVLFLYTAELDALMHRVGIFDDDVRRKLDDYMREVRAILEAARRMERQTKLFLFSDHGMSDVRDTIDLQSLVASWGFRQGRDMLAFYDSTMARFWCKRPIHERLVEQLNATGRGQVITRAELERHGCWFEDQSYGEIIFLLSPGTLIVPSYMGKKAIRAMHGYHPDDPYSKGCFMTNVALDQMPTSIMQLKDFLLAQVGGLQ